MTGMNKEQFEAIIDCAINKFYMGKNEYTKQLNNIEILHNNEKDSQRFLTEFLAKRNYNLDPIFTKGKRWNPYIIELAAFLKLYHYIIGHEDIISGFTIISKSKKFEHKPKDSVKIMKVESLDDFHVFKMSEISKEMNTNYKDGKIYINSNTDPNIASLYRFFNNHITFNWVKGINMMITDEKVRKKYESLLEKFIKDHSQSEFNENPIISLSEAINLCPSSFVESKGGARNIGQQKKKIHSINNYWVR